MRRLCKGTAALCLVLVLGACSDDKPAGSGTTTTSTASTQSSSSSVSTTTTTVAPCSASERPPGAVRVTEGSGDFNGDGTTDTAVVYGEGTEPAPAPWRLLITLGAGKGRAATVISTQSPSEMTVGYLGAATVGDGKSQAAFVNVGFGASDSLVGLFALNGCDLLRVSIEPTTVPGVIPIGGSVTHLDGAQCTGNRLVQHTATSSDGATYEAKSQRYRLEGATLVADGDPSVVSLPADSPDLQSYAILDCPGVTPP